MKLNIIDDVASPILRGEQDESRRIAAIAFGMCRAASGQTEGMGPVELAAVYRGKVEKLTRQLDSGTHLGLCSEKMSILLSVLKGFGAEGGTRTPTSYLTRPSNVRVYQFRHFGSVQEGFQKPGC